MLDQQQSVLVAWLAVAVVVLAAPLVIGLMLLLRHDKDALNWYAGLLTLKPVVTTPIWFSIFTQNTTNPGAVISMMLPGSALTILLALLFRSIFSDPDTSARARKLLALDCARWVSSGAWFIIMSAGAGYAPLLVMCFCALSQLAFFLPTIFAFVALRMVRKAAPDTAATPPSPAQAAPQ